MHDVAVGAIERLAVRIHLGDGVNRVLRPVGAEADGGYQSAQAIVGTVDLVKTLPPLVKATSLSSPMIAP